MFWYSLIKTSELKELEAIKDSWFMERKAHKKINGWNVGWALLGGWIYVRVGEYPTKKPILYFDKETSN